MMTVKKNSSKSFQLIQAPEDKFATLLVKDKGVTALAKWVQQC